jgi:hypothetical protein
MNYKKTLAEDLVIHFIEKNGKGINNYNPSIIEPIINYFNCLTDYEKKDRELKHYIYMEYMKRIE